MKIKFKKGNLNWKTPHRNSLSNCEVQFHWAIITASWNPKWAVTQSQLKLTLPVSSMAKWTWKHFTMLLFEELPFTGFSIAAIKIVSGLPKIKAWGFFFIHFFLSVTIRHLVPPALSCVCRLCSWFRAQPMLCDGMVSLPGFARRNIVWGLIAGLSQHLQGAVVHSKSWSHILL